MKIKYKEPYWVKFQWDVSEHHDNQFVTDFDKTENPVFEDFLHNENYIITCNFKIKNHYKKDDICMIFGKPGKNLGLSYNSQTKKLAFEFWTKGEDEDNFNQITFPDVTEKEINGGITISIIRDGNRIIVFKNFKESDSISFDNNLIDDYKESSFFVGCSSPDCDSASHRYYCEMDINHFSFLNNVSDIDKGKELYESELHNLVIRNYYDNLLFLYDFNTINNIGIVYDESKYTNFLEKVPEKYIK
jgi:hypothetical protein